MIKKVHRNL